MAFWGKTDEDFPKARGKKGKHLFRFLLKAIKLKSILLSS